MTLYDFAAPLYGIWAALVEKRAHGLARVALEACPGRDLLDVAVGTGSEFVDLAVGSAFRRSVGVDLSMGMLRRARRRLKAAPKECAGLCQADARTLPFRAESFDGLLNCYMIDLLPEAEIPIVMREFRRVLRWNGCLVLVTMAQQGPALQKLWMALYRHAPLLVGGCRPVNTAKWLRESGWEVERQEQISQMGFRSELIVARPQASGAGG